MSGQLGRHPIPGDEVGPYRLLERIGSGGMATVFRAADQTGGVVAVKVLNPATVVPEDVKRFTREYQALARIDHPNVVKTYTAGVQDGYPWLALEYIDGTDLGTLVERWSTDPPADRFAQVESLLRGLCKALQYVHDLGLVHRDLKPQNVLVTRSGEAKLTDFGVVKYGDAVTQLTMAGRLVGTVAFMAPEQITGEDIDRRTDLYALGAVLYVMLTSRRPIEAASVAGYLARHLTEVPRPPSEIDPNIPRHLERICQRLLVKDRTARYPTALAVLQALDRKGDQDVLPVRGREQELSRWASRLHDLVENTSGLFEVTGPPGCGRTHLFRSMVDQVANTGAVALWTAAPTDLINEFAQALGVDAADLESGLRAIVGKRPVVLAIDDLDRCTPTQVEAYSRLLRNRAAEGLGVLGLYTLGDGTEAAAIAIALAQTTGLAPETLTLGPLDAKSATSLIRDRGVIGALAPLLGRRLHNDYRGMPGGIAAQVEALVGTGWLARVDPSGAAVDLRPMQAIDAFRKEEFPVPAVDARRIEQWVRDLAPEPRELVELLAAIDRPVAAAQLERCASKPERVERQVEALVAARRIQRDTDEGQDSLFLADPCAGRVIRANLAADVRRARHAAIARALSARRSRSAGLEVARHLELAGELAQAYALYVAAARKSAKDEEYSDVLDVLERIDSLRPAVETTLDATEARRHRIWIELVRGEALLGRGAWEAAAPPLERAAAGSRVETREVLARALSALGRAWYRAGKLPAARTVLEESLVVAEPAAAERAPAARALADILLQTGDLAGSAVAWGVALDRATASGSREGEARARRGLAHLRAVEGRYSDSFTLLEAADDLLDPGGDDRVRAGVLARLIELELAAGRYGPARGRAEVLVDLARRRDMPERLAEAYGLYAGVLLVVGDRDEARDAATQAVVFATAHGTRSWLGRLLAAEVFAELGDKAEAQTALPHPGDVPTAPIDDPPAWVAALRARVSDDTATTSDLATWALGRPPPMLGLRLGRIAIQAGWALLAAGNASGARIAAKRALKAYQGPSLDGAALESLRLLDATAPDERVRAALEAVATRVAAQLSPREAEMVLARARSERV